MFINRRGEGFANAPGAAGVKACSVQGTRRFVRTGRVNGVPVRIVEITAVLYVLTKTPKSATFVQSFAQQSRQQQQQ